MDSSYKRGARIARTVIVVGVLAGAGLFAPFALDAARGTEGASPLETDQQRLDRASFESELAKLGWKPLTETCRAGAPDRVRYEHSGCMTQHWVDIDLRSGEMALQARYEGVFQTAAGAPLATPMRLDAARRAALTTLLSEELPKLPRHLDDFEMPSYSGAIEACLGGEYYFVQRYTTSDEQYAAVSGRLRELVGVRFASKSAQVCL